MTFNGQNPGFCGLIIVAVVIWTLGYGAERPGNAPHNCTLPREHPVPISTQTLILAVIMDMLHGYVDVLSIRAC